MERGHHLRAGSRPTGRWRRISRGAHDLRASGLYNTYLTVETGGVGFSVVEVPEPATMAFLAFGGVGMSVRRRSVREKFVAFWLF